MSSKSSIGVGRLVVVERLQQRAAICGVARLLTR